MISKNKIKIAIVLALAISLSACQSLPGGDARKNPPQPDL